MGFFHEDNERAYNQAYNEPNHEGHFSHELVGGAAAFYAMRKYEEKREAEGLGGKHALAKEFLVGVAGAEAEKLAETKGLDFADRERAKHHAKKEAEQMYDNSDYGRD